MIDATSVVNIADVFQISNSEKFFFRIFYEIDFEKDAGIKKTEAF